MASVFDIYRKCPNPDCVNGKVTINDMPYDNGLPPQEVDCSVCGGIGEIHWGQMRKTDD